MLRPHVEQAIFAYWAERFGCALSTISMPGVHLFPHSAYFAAYQGIVVWNHHHVWCLSVPPKWLPILQPLLSSTTADQLFLPAFWRDHSGLPLPHLIGPSYQGYQDHRVALPASIFHERLLTLSDHVLLDTFRARCSPVEWEHSALSLTGQTVIGAFDHGDLVALAGAKDLTPYIGTIGVITDPQYRGRGAGRTVVAALTNVLVLRRQVVHYQTLLTNQTSLQIAEHLGFEQFATTLAIRLGDGELLGS